MNAANSSSGHEPVRVDRIIPGGEAIATRADGKKILLWNALPGELVNYQVDREKSKLIYATATEIIEPSQHRIDPKDPCFLATSPWQIMDYDYELAQKSLLVQEIFRQQGIAYRNPSCSDAEKDPEHICRPLVITDGRDFHYRNKMEYSLYWDNDTQQISLGFHARNSHRKIPVTQSSIEHPEIFAQAQEIIADLNTRQAQARDYQSLLLRCDQQGNVSGGLYENGKPHPDFPSLTDRVIGHEYTYSPNGFFQINLPVYELALQEIAKHIDTDNILDLYAGVGTIGLSVAADKNLTLVEVNKAAYLELEKNCAGKHQPVLAKSEEVLDCIQPDQTVIVDPPRAGCDPALIEKIATTKPSRLIYLSCNPITQARDIAPLLDIYNLEKVIAFNFFPRTPHIENLAILVKK